MIQSKTTVVNSQPVSTVYQELPLEQLSGKRSGMDFEHLCCDLMIQERHLQNVHLYSKDGTEQYGIDIWATRDDNSIVVAQCKQTALQAHQIRKLIAEIEHSAWIERGLGEIRIYTSKRLGPTAEQEFETQHGAPCKRKRIPSTLYRQRD